MQAIVFGGAGAISGAASASPKAGTRSRSADAVSGVGGFCQPNPRFVYVPYRDGPYVPRRQRAGY